jgi:hypothetical protein
MMENDEKNQVEENEKILNKSATKLAAVKAMRALSNQDSEWTIVQEIYQDVVAAHIIINPDKLPPVTQMVEELKKEIELRYAEDEELRKLLLDSVPEPRAIRIWQKKEGWEEAVWKRIKSDKLFSAEKRAQVIESLRKRAIDNSDQAAKLWLTLSGDYSDKVEVNDKTIETFREINSILHKNKSKS